MSSWYLSILIGIVVIVAAVFVWRWWKNRKNNSLDKLLTENTTETVVKDEMVTSEEMVVSKEPPPMLFAVNDQGNLDLTDFDGRILNSSFGSSPKIYINLLDQVSKDVEESETPDGNKTFMSKVGTTKLYTIADKPYIVNYTRLM